MYLLPETEGQTNFPVWSEKVLPVISCVAQKTLLVRMDEGSVTGREVGTRGLTCSTLAAAAAA